MSSLDDHLYMYAIVRGDLEMTPGKLSAQAGHAYTDSLFVCLDENSERAREYRSPEKGGSKVTLKSKNEIDLLMAVDACREKGVPHALVVDHGHVMPPFFDGSPIITALGIGPVTKMEVKDITKRFGMV